VYVSTKYNELYVIDKVNGGKADALNCGVNYARYPYVCGVDADTVVEKDALLKAMRLILRDPERTVGVGSLVGMNNGFWIEKGAIRERSIPSRPLIMLQMLEYLRSFLLARLSWSRMNAVICIIGAFGVYRRDLIAKVGGFSREFSCEDIEMTYRIHDYLRRNKQDYRIYSLPDPICWTEMPDTFEKFYNQRHRWQRVYLETVISYRHMLFNPKFGALGFLGAPYLLFWEVLDPVFMLASLLLIPAGILFGILSWTAFAGFMGIIILLNALTDIEGIFLQDIGYRTFSFKDIAKAVFTSFLEWFGFRQFHAFARLAGTVGFLRGEKAWRKFERIKRTADTPEKK
jgi:cellulose synthase/poly-beta-1,6-N-acetylglucosamine synthase-like glycosyltransferase